MQRRRQATTLTRGRFAGGYNRSSMLVLSLIALTIVIPLVTLSALGLVVAPDIGSCADGFAATLLSVSPPIANRLRRPRGRPRKFDVPSRAVTLTLPDKVLDALAAIDPDPSRAVVRLASRRPAQNGRGPAELTVFGRRAVITVRPTPSLERRAGVDLVPLPDGRALISFDHPQTIAALELELYDALDDPQLTGPDRLVFQGIVEILKEARRSADVELQRRNIIVIEMVPPSRGKAVKTSHRR